MEEKEHASTKKVRNILKKTTTKSPYCKKGAVPKRKIETIKKCYEKQKQNNISTRVNETFDKGMKTSKIKIQSLKYHYFNDFI